MDRLEKLTGMSPETIATNAALLELAIQSVILAAVMGPGGVVGEKLANMPQVKQGLKVACDKGIGIAVAGQIGAEVCARLPSTP